jgi:peptidoglycan/LPS O-acetylase OafA/YrhL
MNRLNFLDAVRALLAWMVVAIHTLYFNHFSWIMHAGPWVVGAFFVLSGFIITRILSMKHEPYGVFVIRRMFRLAPVFFVCLGFALLVRHVTIGSYGPEAAREASENAAFGTHLLAHLTMLHGLVPEILLPHASDAYLPPAWSISVELQFYLVAPMIVWFLRNSVAKVPAMLTAASCMVLAAPLHWRLFSYWDHLGGALPQQLWLFMAGALLYHYWPSFGKWPAPRWLVWLGRRSYATYLIHYPLLAVYNVVLDSRGSQYERILIMFIGAAPLIVVLSALLYRWIEKPGIALGKALTGLSQQPVD